VGAANPEHKPSTIDSGDPGKIDMTDTQVSAAGQPDRKSLEESPPKLNVELEDMQELDLQEVNVNVGADVNDDFGEVDLDDGKDEKEKREVEEEEQVELRTSTSLRAPSPSSIEDKKKNNRRVTMAFRSTTPLNSSPALGNSEHESPRQSEESVRQPEVHNEPLENLDLEAVSLDEDAREKNTLRPEQTNAPEEASPSIGAKLGLTSAFGYAASLLPSTSPSKVIERGPSPAENASAGPSRTSSYSSLTPVPHDPVPIDPTRTAAPPAASGSWTSSFTNYFGSKSPSISSLSSPLPNIPSPFRKGVRPTPPKQTDSTGTAFLLHNLDATKEERRRSVEAGGSMALKEGFERVKRDSTRLREAAAYGDIGEFDEDDEEAQGPVGRRRSSVKPSTASASQSQPQPQPKATDYSDDQEPDLGPDGVDWPFWGCVMNDYEAIARSRPRDLSRAIQQGIPAVVRGTIWQLMSSSKNPALESTYAGLLKEKSPHEKAIQKDLARTLPGHRYFAQGGGVGQENLFNVVKAYSLCVSTGSRLMSAEVREKS
jgi:hypothetical protein